MIAEHWISELLRWLFQIVPITYVVRSWMKWSKAPANQADLRGKISFVGFLTANVGVALSAFIFTYSFFVDLGFYNPVEMFCIGIGLLIALVGLICACAGKGLLRVPTAILSAFIGLLWFGAAMAQ